MHFCLLFGTLSVLFVSQISGSKVFYKTTNASRPHEASPPHGPHVTYQYINQATLTNDDTKKLHEKIQRVDDRLTRLIALFILQKKAGMPSIRRSDGIKKQEEKLEQVNDGLTQVIGLLQNIAGSSSSKKNDDVKKLISDSLENKAGMPWIPNKGRIVNFYAVFLRVIASSK